MQQMIIIFILIAIGVFLFKTGRLDKKSTKDISWIVVNVTNPIMILSAALEDDDKVDARTLLIAFAAFAVVYLLLALFSLVIPVVLGIKKGERYPYRYMSIFANVGFIGIPFCSAVLGVHSLIYVSICSLVFNVIFYTAGIAIMSKIGAAQNPDKAEEYGKNSLLRIINGGSVFSVITITIYLMDFEMPDIAMTTLSYIGRSTTFLSMAILGVSVAQVALKEIFGKWRLYLFVLIRQIAVPIILIFVLRPFIRNELMLNTIILLSAMPCANLPLMTAKQFEVKEGDLSSGIILTTLLSVVTLPLVATLL